MGNPILASAAFPSGLSQRQPDRDSVPAAPESAALAVSAQGQANAADLRLVIEEDGQTGRFVYKTYDRQTGELVRQFPREDVLKMSGEPDYAPGGVITARG